MRVVMTIENHDNPARMSLLGRHFKRVGSLRDSSFGDTFEKVFVLSATHAVSGFLVLATFISLANKLGPRLYGEFTFVDSVLFIAILCASLGTEYVGNREVARTKDSAELVSGILILRAAASMVALVFILAWAFFFIDSGSLRLLMIISAGVLLSVPGIAGWFFLARHKIKLVAIATLARELTFFVPVVFFLDGIADPETRLIYAGIFFLGSRLVFAGIFLTRLLAENGFNFKVRASTYRYVMKDSLALLYASLVSSITISVQIYMLKLLREDYALGVYGAIFKQIFYIQLLSLSFIMVFFPLLSKAWIEDRKKYERLASALSELTLVVVLPVAMTGILYSDYILRVFFSSEYQGGGLTLQLLCLSLIPMSYVRVLTTGILISMDMTSKMYSLVNWAFIGSIFSCVLIFALPGADSGAAASRLASECLFVAISYVAVAGRIRVIMPGVLRSVLPATASMVITRALVPDGYEGVGIAGCYLTFFIVYLGALYLTRADELRAVLRGGRADVAPAPEQILMGREKT